MNISVILLIIELGCGVAALVLTAMAFTNLSWAEGASSQEMKRAAGRQTKRLFAWSGVMWVLAFVCYLAMRWL